MSSFVEIFLKKDEVIFHSGDLADKLYYLKSGSIGMKDSITGDIFATVGEGESFGEQAMLIGGIRAATAIATQNSICFEIKATDLKDLLKKQSPILTPIFEALILQQNMHNALIHKTD
jgi:CRP-like cAMP-binding protein